ncbi:MAG TPA: sugar-binding protein [Ignavibacteriaceae bacterium]|nr:sugar-binding protein [Ignavibacteriaceae bacterium]
MKYYCFPLAALLSLFLYNELYAYTPKELAQDDTVLAANASVLPVIDGIGDDQCWKDAPWQSIDQVWIPYGGEADSHDYTGRYKIVWSSESNLLYFLVEITDDSFIDGFIPDVTTDIFNFDITEVFIDEDASGGLHMYDSGQQNAENAFAYHMYSPFPEPGDTTSELYVDDMATGGRPNYATHFPDFIKYRTSDTSAVFEFSLIVFDDTYNENNKDASRVLLNANKVIGLSVAYCDNDNPDGQRDNMFGSVWEPSPGNLHWQNADYFGRVKLVQGISSGIADEQSVNSNTIQVYPNPSSSFVKLQLNDPYNGEIMLRLYNVLGQEVFRISDIKTTRLFNKTVLLNNLATGIYFLQTQFGKISYTKKLIIH